MMPSRLTTAAATTGYTFLVLLLATHTATAYRPADGPGHVCRPLRLDETAWRLPAVPSAGVAGDLPAVPLVEEKDLWPRGGSAAIVSEGATLRLEAWVQATNVTSSGGGDRCFPNALTLAAGPDRLRIPLPPQPMDWLSNQWNDIEAPVSNLEHVAWAALNQLAPSYACGSGEGDAQEPEIKVRRQSQPKDCYFKLFMMPYNATPLSQQVRLVRICTPVPAPSLCLVASTVKAKTDCRPCDDSGESCCESQSFTACSKALTYGVAALSPTAGEAGGGAHVLVKATTEFVEPTAPAASMAACRFGDDAIVPATVLSGAMLACVAPPLGYNLTTTAMAVPVEVTLDGGKQWTHDGRAFTYCADGDAACLHDAHPADAGLDPNPNLNLTTQTMAADPAAGGRRWRADLQQGQGTAAVLMGLVLMGLVLAAVAGAIIYVHGDDAGRFDKLLPSNTSTASFRTPLLARGRGGVGGIELVVKAFLLPPPMKGKGEEEDDEDDMDIMVLG